MAPTGSAYSSFDGGPKLMTPTNSSYDGGSKFPYHSTGETPHREETANSGSPLIEHATHGAAPQSNKRDSWQPFLRGGSSEMPAKSENLDGNSHRGLESSSVVRFKSLAESDQVSSHREAVARADSSDGELDFQVSTSLQSNS